LNEKPKAGLGGEFVLPAILIVVTAVYLIEGMRTLRPFQEGTAGPSFFPIVVSVIMIVALGSVMWGAWRRTGRREEAAPAALAEPIKVVLVTAVYIALFRPAGYFVSTALYVLALLYVFRFKARHAWVNLVWAVLISGACFVLFSEVFRIRLPKLGGII
jgi:putative tricarboxylic transport membrane protein